MNPCSPSNASCVNPAYILAGGSFTPGGGGASDPALDGTTHLCTSPTGKPYVNAPGGVTIYLGPDSGGNYGNIQVSTCVSIAAPATGSTAGIAFGRMEER